MVLKYQNLMEILLDSAHLTFENSKTTRYYEIKSFKAYLLLL